MINLIKASLVTFTLICSLTTSMHAIANAEIDSNQSITPLVSVKWLKENLNAPNVIVLDTSMKVEFIDGNYISSNAFLAFKESHIPTARYVNLKSDLSAPDTSKDFIMPSITQFQTAMRKYGVNNDSHVILYSRNNQSWPARVWWMLKWAGFDNASILDGGLKAWEKAGLETIAGTQPKVKVGAVDFKELVNLVAKQSEVKAAIFDKSVTIIDSLMPVHYKGDFSLYKRAGHITSAVNLPSSGFVDESGLFKSVDELELTLDGDRSARQITYCGGGVAASVVAFNLYRAGFKDVAVYMGSLQEWVEDPENPMTLGEQP